MGKAGDGYQQIVGTVMTAFQPDAEVKVGTWVTGPDGRRDMDVMVQGTKSGQKHVALIECKDWARPIGIEKIDALESKRRDLNVDSCFIFSNSGFTRDALAKAQRVGIQAAAALKHGEDQIKVVFPQVYIGQSMSAEGFQLIIRIRPGDCQPATKGDERSVTYEGRSVYNWAYDRCKDFLNENITASHVVMSYGIKRDVIFERAGPEASANAISIPFHAKPKWYSQIVTVDASLGYYDYHRCRIIIPESAKAIFTFNPKDCLEIDNPSEGEKPIFIGVNGRAEPTGIQWNWVRLPARDDGRETADLGSLVDPVVITQSDF